MNTKLFEDLPVSLSPLDEARFGVKIARALDIRKQQVPLVFDACASGWVKLLIARSRTDDLSTAQALIANGAQLMDTLIYLERDLVDLPVPSNPGPVTIRESRIGEAEEIKQIAAEAFRGYQGHYHNDPRLDASLCDDIYPDWAARLCRSADGNNAVFIAEINGKMVGFSAVRLNNAEEGEAVLTGVVKSSRRMGVKTQMNIALMGWCRSQGAKRMLTSLLINNLGSFRSWIAVGFKPCRSYYTFHKWFD